MASSTTAEVAAPAPTAADSPAKTPKKTKATKPNVKKPRKLASHPPVHEMITAAIENLKDRKGSSLQAIKKYIASSYTCDVAKLATFIRKALKTGVEKGTFVQTTGTGASGSFKLKAVDRKANKDAAGEEKKKRTTKPVGGKKAAKQSSTRKPTGEKKAQKKPVEAKVAKKAGAVKRTTAAPKLTATKPSKTAVAKPKNARSRKAASVRNVAARK